MLDSEPDREAGYAFPRAGSKRSAAVTLRTVLPAAASGADEPVGSALLLPRASELVVRSDLEQLHLRALTRPPWAHTIGRDGNGLFVAFGAGEGERRARWWNRC